MAGELSGERSDLRRRRVGVPASALPDQPDPAIDASEILPAAQTGVVHALLVILYHLSLIGLALYGLLWVPSPLGLEAPPALFSEGRALKHAAYLSEDIGDRKVGTHNVEVAARYVVAEALAIAELAKEHPHLTAEVDREQATGGINAQFAGVQIASAYNNLTNVILYIAPRNLDPAQMPPALLLNSHFDSVFGTKGASDCGSCVGVMLEIARALAADPGTVLEAPLLFLFNGGEETLLLAAHGFMASSRWAPQVGAFINLESTGPGGPGYLFQHTGGWTVQAFARAAKYPHGSVCGQDFFDSRLLKMDTDFRMFSAQHHGSLPGIDIAYILDGAAYHTNHDTVDRIRKGTVQASGENILRAALEISRLLALPEGPPVIDSNAVFFDFLGRFMVRYSWETGRVLHSAPLAIVVLAIVTSHVSGGGPKLRAVLNTAGLTFSTLISAILVAAFSGTTRALLTGKSMVWFGKPALFVAIYGPAALGGLLLPFTYFRTARYSLRASLLGVGLMHGCIAAGLTAVKGRSAFMSAAWALTSAATAYITPKQGSLTPRNMLSVLILSAPAGMMVAPFAAALPIFVMEHISISGAPPQPIGYLVGDTAIGAVIGLAAFVTGSFYAHLIAHAAGRRLPRVVALLLVTSAAFATYASVSQTAYSPEFPKRVLLQHYHRLGLNGKVAESRWSVAGLDPIPVEVVLPPATVPFSTEQAEWQGLFPISSLLRGVSLPGPPPQTAFTENGRPAVKVQLIKRQNSPVEGQRLHLLLQAAKPPWGTFNMTGDLLAWSFTDSLHPSFTNEAGEDSFMVRFAGNDNEWPFWVDIKEGSSLHISAAILFMDQTPEIDDFAAALPDWTNVMPFTCFHAVFEFS